MSRARNIKPGFFKNDLLAECDPLARILFQGLWCEADRDGRLEYRPKRIKAEILPYDDCEIDALIQQLAKRGFVQVYEVDDNAYLQVVNFLKHQNPHVKEAASSIPAPSENTPAPCEHHTSTVQEQNKHTTNPADSLNLIPDSLIPQKAIAQPAVSPNAFETFWQRYPRKQGKANAQKAWAKQKLDPQLDTILRHVELMRCEDVGWQDPQYIPHASTYLNQQRWHDEPQRGNPNARNQQNRKLSAVEQVQQSIRNAEQRERGFSDAAFIEGTAYRVDTNG